MEGSSIASAVSVTVGSVLEQDAEFQDRGLALLVGVVLLHQELDRLEEPVHEEEERRQLTDLQLMVQHHVAAHGQDHRLTDDAEELGAGAVDAVDTPGVVVGVAVLADHVAVIDHVVALPVVGRDDPHALQALRQVGQHERDAVAHLVVAALGGPLEPDRHGEEHGHHHDDGDEGKFHVGREEEDGDDDHRQSLNGELRQAVLEQLLQVLDVAGHPAHDDAGLLLGEEVERESLEVAEDGDPQVVHDPGGEPARHPDLTPLRGGGNDHREQVDAGDEHDHREVLVAGGHAVVDGDTGQPRTELGRHAR